MKKEIHPDYKPLTITCVCGNTIETGSVKKDIRVEICSNCHPFYAGTQKIVDTEGRVDRFNKRYAEKDLVLKTAKKLKAEKKAQEELEKRRIEEEKEQARQKAIRDAKKEAKEKEKARAKAAEEMLKQVQEEKNKQEESKQEEQQAEEAKAESTEEANS